MRGEGGTAMTTYKLTKIPSATGETYVVRGTKRSAITGQFIVSPEAKKRVADARAKIRAERTKKESEQSSS